MAQIVRGIREHVRSAVSLPAQCIDEAGTSVAIRITNLSIGGCEIIPVGGALVEGISATIKVDGCQGLPGVVCWTASNRAGFRFSEKLQPTFLWELFEANRAKGLQRSVA